MNTDENKPWIQHLNFINNLKIVEYKNGYTLDIFLDALKDRNPEGWVFDTKEECEDYVEYLRNNPLFWPE